MKDEIRKLGKKLINEAKNLCKETNACGLILETAKSNEIGNVVLGLGILFLGLKLMSNSMEPLAKSDFFINMIFLLGWQKCF